MVYRFKKSGLFFLAIAAILLSVLGSVGVTAYEGDNIQSYGANQKLDSGVIVKLSEKDSKQVQAADEVSSQNMLGVVIDSQNLPIQLSTKSLKNEVYVATSGTHSTLVSTQGGEIRPGDYIALSSIAGIGMKAGTEKTTVFGRAGREFTGKDVNVGSMTLKDTDGKANKTVKLGVIPVTIEIKRNPNIKSTKTKVPQVLERLGQAVAEKEVSALRIYLSVAITAISLFIALLVIYSGVKNSVISIGRNPMSKKSIFRALFEIILTSILILIVGLFAVYLLLKL